MYYVYVLKSTDHDLIYIGVTENPARRLEEHNKGTTKSTRPYIPYKLIYSECYQNKKDALQRERQIKKSGKIRNELKKGTYMAPSSIG